MRKEDQEEILNAKTMLENQRTNNDFSDKQDMRFVTAITLSDNGISKFTDEGRNDDITVLDSFVLPDSDGYSLDFI
jgi:hypothetical protein